MPSVPTPAAEVERRGRPEATRSDQQHARVEQLQLSCLTDLRDQEMARVARAALRRQRARHDDLEPVALPVLDAAGERVHVLVPELRERLRREGRACADGAVDDDRLRLVGGETFDAALEVAARDEHGTG